MSRWGHAATTGPADVDRTGGALPAVLAIDGGNSKTDVALVSADGGLVATARGPGLTQHRDVEESLHILDGLVEAVRVEPCGGPVARHTSACLANVDLPEEEARTAEMLAGRGWSSTMSLANDTFAVLRAGTGRPPDATVAEAGTWGVAVVCGAGINCVGVDPTGRTTRFLAFGELSGDWGGAGTLARETLWWAIRDEDGRGPPTTLRDAVAGHFGCSRVHDVVVGVHQGRIGVDELRELTPVLLKAADGGDRVARRVVERQADEIATMALTAMRRLDLAGRETPVVLGGGVLTARSPVLVDAIAAALLPLTPLARIRVIDVPPVVGAALLGLDHEGGTAETERRLRAAVKHAGTTPAGIAGA